MKTAILAVALGTLAAPALAQQVPAPQLAAGSAQPAATKFAVDKTPIEQLAADPAARAAVEKQVPGLFEHPAYEMIKTMTLAAIQPYSQGKITDEVLARLQADLAAIK